MIREWLQCCYAPKKKNPKSRFSAETGKRVEKLSIFAHRQASKENMRINNCVVILTIAALLSGCDNKQSSYLKEEGRVHGTIYHMTYEKADGASLQDEYIKEFEDFDMSLSTFKDSSIISRINKNDTTVRTDEYFNTVFAEGEKISELTNGAFDMTVAKLVNAWGFGFDKKDNVTEEEIAELKKHMGYKKVRLEGDRVIKEDTAIMLDASAIAKGYSSDVVGKLLEKNGVENYMVEIGGECTIKGLNPKGKKWSIGITKPVDDSTQMQNEIQEVVYLTDCGLATSGNYRQFYHKDGKKYSHTIDPRTGHPVDHTLLSTSVIAKSCMEADALATACMVLGLDSAKQMIEKIDGVEALFISSDERGKYDITKTSGFGKITSEK